MLTRRAFLKLLSLGFGSALGSVSYPLFEAMARPRTAYYKLALEGWKHGPPIRICAISDVHACDPWMTASRIGSICDQANALGADIILLLGDYLSGMDYILGELEPRLWAEQFARLSAPLGVHAILGNHDYWDDPVYQKDHSVTTVAELALKAVGIPVYVNRSVRLTKDGRHFWLSGLGDQLAIIRRRKPYFPLGIQDVDRTLADITDHSPILMMAHEPDIFPYLPKKVALTLSGHTHGGQVNFFGWRPYAASEGSKIYPAGHFAEGQKNIVVSRGLGCSGLPLRFGSWPEIMLIDLESREEI